MTRNVNRASAMIMCSSSISKPSSSTGSVAAVAHRFDTPARRASAYTMTAMASPIRC